MKKGTIVTLLTVAGIASGTMAIRKICKAKEAKIWKVSDKHLALFLLMNQWVKVKQENKSIAEYLLDKGYKQIAIYGMNFVGETLLDELTGSDIEVKYGIDKNAKNIYSDIEIVSPENSLEDVDAVIVTAITYFDEIEEKMSEKVNGVILSLEDILNEM